MSPETKPLNCLNCDQPETQVPLISIRYAGKAGWVCSQCMPALIHEPQQVGDKLARLNESDA